MSIGVDLIGQGFSLNWANSFGGNNNDRNSKIAIDSSGNIYSAGYFRGTVDFDPGSSTYNLTSSSLEDAFIQKLDSNGNFIWAGAFAGNGFQGAVAIDVDDSGNVYIAGHFENTADFNPNWQVYSMSSQGGDDVFIVKLDANGNFVWAKQISSGVDESVVDLSFRNDRVFVLGWFKGSLDFDPSSSVFNVSASGQQDLYFLSLTANGDFDTVITTGGSSSIHPKAFGIDQFGSIFITGGFYGNVDLNPGSGSATHSSASSTSDVFLLKWDSAGNYQWSYDIGSGSNDVANDIAIDQSGNAIITGEFLGTVDFDPGGGVSNVSSSGIDVFVYKFSNLGQPIWFKTVGGSLPDKGFAIDVDQSGRIYVLGFFHQNVDFDPGSGSFILNAGSFRSAFMLNLSDSGSFITAGAISGSSYVEGYDIKVINQDCYLAGIFRTDADFDFSLDTNELFANGGDDAFVAKYSKCSYSEDSISMNECDSALSPDGLNYWYSSGIYFDTLIATSGCDSIITVDLAILNSTSFFQSISICDSFLSPSGNDYWTITGFYQDTLQNAVGCDSVIGINLIVLESTETNLSVSACDSFLSPSSNHTWFSTGVYNDTLSNAVGCDSFLVIDLTIKESTDTTLLVEVCDQYTSPSQNSTWTVSGNYLDTIQNSNGCDSILHINLIVNNSFLDTIEITECDSFYWPISDSTYYVSGIYSESFTTQSGCDSTHVMVLEINQSSYVSTDSVIVLCSGEYYWNVTDSTYNEGGLHLAAFTNQYGCDSTHLLHLAFIDTIQTEVSDTGCNSYYWPYTDSTYVSSGSYTGINASSQGCDSLVTLNLTIFNLDTSIQQFPDSLVSNFDSGSYQWLSCLNNEFAIITGATDKTLTLTQNGDYAVVVSNAYCSDTSVCVSANTVGFSESVHTGFEIYPNPSDGFLYISTGKLKNINGIKLFDSQGSVKEIIKVHSSEEYMKLQLPTKAGLYFIQLESEGQIHWFRVIRN